MFDFSWGEVLVIGGVALIVIGPKDLPKALRTVGQMTSKVRRMAGEFQAQFNEAMREAELDEVRKDLQGLNSSVTAATSTAFNPIQTIRDEIKGAVEAKPGVATTAVSPLAPEPEAAVAAPAAALEAEPMLPLPEPPARPALEPPAPVPAIAAEPATDGTAGPPR
jgi:sec-independent protein translocase protein TatB